MSTDENVEILRGIALNLRVKLGMPDDAEALEEIANDLMNTKTLIKHVQILLSSSGIE